MITRRIVLLAFAGLALWAAPAQAQGGAPAVKLVGGVIYHSEVIPPGATVRFVVTCPKGHGATGSTVSSADPAAILLLNKLLPSAAGYSFGWRNSDAAKPKTVVVAVTCAKALPAVIAGPGGGFFPVRPPGAKVNMKQLMIQAMGSDTLEIPCPKDKVFTGLEEGTTTGKGAVTAASPGVGELQLTAIVPTKRGVSVTARNPTAIPQPLVLKPRCAPKTAGSGKDQVRLRTNTSSFNVQVGPSGSVVRGACPKQIPLFAGFSLPPDGSLGFVGAGFSKGAFTSSWALSNSTGVTQPARVHLVCVPGRFKFVRGLAAGAVIETAVGPIQITG